MHYYYKLLANRPYVVVIAVVIFSISCIIAGCAFNKLPDFSDPTMGFEARGTIIGQKLTAWKNLLDERKLFVVNPKELIVAAELEKAKALKMRKNGRKKNKLKGEQKIRDAHLNRILFDETDNVVNFTNYNLTANWEYGRNLSFLTEEINQNIAKNKEKWSDLRQSKPPMQKINIQNGFFCDSPRVEYAHFVIKRTNEIQNSSLFQLDVLLAICDIEQRLTLVEGFNSICQKQLLSKNCCRPWSIPNYIILLAGKENCSDLNDTDVSMVRQLLLNCYPYFNSFKLNDDCTESKCQVPDYCSTHNAVFNIFQFLSNVDFVNVNDSTTDLKETMIFLPIARSSKALPFYHNLDKSTLKNEIVEIIAMDMGLKNALFDECLISDACLIAAGAFFVIICMWLYTSSLFVTLMTIVAIIFSLGISYFIYTIILKINFFPFMNLLAVIVIIGIGADDAFIFMKIWKCTQSDQVECSASPSPTTTVSWKAQNKSALVFTLKSTLEHAGISMLVTSFTTAAAFFASTFSSITAVRCFGIFAGTLVLVNYLLMITWLPAIVSITEQFSVKFKCLPFTIISNSMLSLGKHIEDNIIKLINMYPIILILLLSAIGIISSYIVLYKPKLQLPDSSEFELFVKTHPFELYDTLYKNKFWFEKMFISTENFKLPLRFIWGVKAIDTGNYLDPLSRGSLYVDDSFNISAPESQQWLFDFCKSLKQQPFYSLSYGVLLPNCFIENLIRWMARRCLDEMSGTNRYPCCEDSVFPYSAEVFDICLPESISSLYETPREYFMPSNFAGPKFSRDNVSSNNNRVLSPVLAIVIEYESSQVFTMSYIEMAEFVNKVNNWFAETLKTAPSGLRNGWFISDLQFYDLQDSLSKGTLFSILLSIGASLLVLFLVTFNIIISFYAIITVTLTIFTSIAVLVGIGWKLNVLESVAVSTVIGLSIDFSLHYGVHYQLCNDPNRQLATKFSLSRMMKPTLMAAITTIVAGALMIFSSVLAYIQIGIFLVVVMTISWFYSTFFLMSVLRLFGPQYGFGQIEPLKYLCNKNDNNTILKRLDVDKRTIHHQSLISENLISISELVTSESHELDSLTTSSTIKQLDNSRSSNTSNYKKKHSFQREHSPSIGSIVTVLPDDSSNVE